jgi:phosphoribosylglycinamide formyltransferase-1
VRDYQGGTSLIFKSVLMTENNFHATYLVTKWLDTFEQDHISVVLRESELPEPLLRERAIFHRNHKGEHSLSPRAEREVTRLYSDFGPTEAAMIEAFGVPAHTVTDAPDTAYLGKKINAPSVREWLARECSGPVKPFFFIFLDRMLAPWWIELAESRIINSHSAVLPVARGAHAIEQIAADRDFDRFSAAVGATAHYIDNGVDSGPVVGGARFSDPFRFNSIWDCKAHQFMLAYDVLIEVADQLRKRPGTVPLGARIEVDDTYPDFKFAEFTAQRRRQAELGYLAMRADATSN